MGVPSPLLVHQFPQLAGEVKPCHKLGYLPITYWYFVVIPKNHHVPSFDARFLILYPVFLKRRGTAFYGDWFPVSSCKQDNCLWSILLKDTDPWCGLWLGSLVCFAGVLK